MRKPVQHVSHQQLLVLLFVLQAERQEITNVGA